MRVLLLTSMILGACLGSAIGGLAADTAATVPGIAAAP